jgi:hypothetical protein
MTKAHFRGLRSGQMPGRALTWLQRESTSSQWKNCTPARSFAHPTPSLEVVFYHPAQLFLSRGLAPPWEIHALRGGAARPRGRRPDPREGQENKKKAPNKE